MTYQVTIYKDPEVEIAVVQGQPPVDQSAQVAALTAQVATLTAQVTTLTAQVESTAHERDVLAGKIAAAQQALA